MIFTKKFAAAGSSQCLTPAECIKAFFPHYKMTDVPPTPLETLLKAYEIAKGEGFNYVYLGNVPHGDYEDTFCPSCGNRLVERRGFSAKIVGLKDGRCEIKKIAKSHCLAVSPHQVSP